MQDVTTLLELVKGLRTWTFYFDSIGYGAMVVCLGIIILFLKNQNKTLKDRLDLWKPKDIKEDAKAVVELKVERIKEEFAKNLEKNKEMLKKVQTEKEETEKLYGQLSTEKSGVEKRSVVLETNIWKLFYALSVLGTVAGMLGMVSNVKDMINLYTDLNLPRDFPDAPHPRKFRERISQPEKGLVQIFSIVGALRSFQTDKPIDISKELISRFEEIDKISAEIHGVMDSVSEYLDRFFALKEIPNPE